MTIGAEESTPGETWTPGKFQTELITAVRRHSLAETRLPQGIDVGKEWMAMGIKMLQDSLADPHRRERLRYAKLNLQNQIEIPDQETIADISNNYEVAGTWTQRKNPSPAGPQYTHYEGLVFDMHVHPIEAPPSSGDLSTLFYDEGAEAEFVIAPQTSYLILKTLDTPQMSFEETQAKDAKWKKIIHERFLKIAAMASDEDHYYALSTKASWAFVRDVSKKYHFGVYTTDTLRSSTFTRARFNSI